MTQNPGTAAVRYFVERNHNCAQSVVRAVLEKYDLNYEQSASSMAGIGGGVGLEGNVCGVVVGAVSALGVLNSQRFTDFEKHKDATYTSSVKFIHKFKKKFETVICDNLTGITMSDLEIRNKAEEEELFYKTCPKYLDEAVRLVIELEEKARLK